MKRNTPVAMTRARSLSVSPSRHTLGGLPARVVVFLRAIGTYSPIRAAMQRGGFTEKDHGEGFALLHAACGWGTAGVDPTDDVPAREASAELAAWTRGHVARLRVAVERLHPEDAGLFAGIDVIGVHDDAGAAILAVASLLKRLDEAERGRGNRDAASSGATTGGAPVIATLAQRGLTRDERARLASLVAVAQTAVAPENAEPARAPREDEHVALYRWYIDWAATARVTVRRRDWLRVMGLAGGRDAASES